MRSRSGSGRVEAAKGGWETLLFAGTLSLVFLTAFLVLGASSADAAVPCPNDVLRMVGPSENLPDCRAYEQATSTNKGATSPRGGLDLVAASSGEPGTRAGITFYATGGIPGGTGSQNFPQYLARRAADGSTWSTQGLLPPASNGSAGFVRGYSEDLSDAYVTQADLPGERGGFYQLNSDTHALHEMVSGVTYSSNQTRYAGESAGGSMVLVELFDSQIPAGAGAKTQNAYVWEKATGLLTPVGVFNSGEAPAGGTSPGAFEFKNTPSNYTSYENAISTDDSHVFFTSITTHQIYLRLNPTQPQNTLGGEECTDSNLACTIQVSKSKRTIPPLADEKPATLWVATPDGSQAFFTSSGKLTNDATTGAEDKGHDLYRYDADSGGLTDLTPDTEPTDPNGADVQGVVGISDNGSHVYFVANGVLTAVPNSEGKSAEVGNCKTSAVFPEFLEFTTGHCNLYLWHEGTISFVAPQLAVSNNQRTDASNWVRKPAALGGTLSEKTARTTADGSTLLFRSREKLTSYDNQGLNEFYRYTDQNKELRCITCNPTTAVAPVGSASLQNIAVGTLNVPKPAPIQTRNLSADGTRIFFESPDKLVASDINGNAGCPPIGPGARQLVCQDVYEWEAKNTGGCDSEEQNGGCLYLLSTGTSPEPSYFGDASATGDDAFIFTAQPLVEQDKDELVDIYDARTYGGIASQNEKEKEPCPSLESCRPTGASPPTAPSPGSSSFAGPPNPTYCKKGFKKVKRHGKTVCARKKHHKKNRQPPGRHG